MPGQDGVDGIDGIDAVIDYDSLANLISADSILLQNVSAGNWRNGCDIKFPEGFDGESITQLVQITNPYIVPSNKRLIILSTDQNVEINGVIIRSYEG